MDTDRGDPFQCNGGGKLNQTAITKGTIHFRREDLLAARENTKEFAQRANAVLWYTDNPVDHESWFTYKERKPL